MKKDSNIFTETTLKLKTKFIFVSGISLFIGLTETLPTKLALIGLSFEKNEKILGWFLLAITIVLFMHFLLIGIVEVRKYYKSRILHPIIEKLTARMDMTLDLINSDEYNRHEYSERIDIDTEDTLAVEENDIENKKEIIEFTFDKQHLKFSEIIELVFNLILPISLGVVSIYFLCNFLNS